MMSIVMLQLLGRLHRTRIYHTAFSGAAVRECYSEVRKLAAIGLPTSMAYTVIAQIASCRPSMAVSYPQPLPALKFKAGNLAPLVFWTEDGDEARWWIDHTELGIASPSPRLGVRVAFILSGIFVTVLSMQASTLHPPGCLYLIF